MSPFLQRRFAFFPNSAARALGIGILAVNLLAVCLMAHAEEEQVTFYPTYGYMKDGIWRIPVRIWVHEEPRLLQIIEKSARGKVAERAGITKLDEAQKELFRLRVHDFIADNESGELVVFQFDNDPDNNQYAVKSSEGEFKTDRNGLVEGALTLPEETAQKLLSAQNSKDGWLTYKAVSDEHVGIGQVRLIQPKGRSVISDIDDTIKITEIPAGESTVLKNTFFRDFVAVPCMAEMYRAFGNDVAFHYISGGPWQMYGSLSEFLFSEKLSFPRGSFHMKNVRTNPFESETYQDLWALIANGSQAVTFKQKITQISTLLQHFPERTFILIGDSGEKDPEIFRQISKTFPSRIEEIRIRDVVNDKANKPERLAGMVVIPPDQGASCDQR